MARNIEIKARVRDFPKLRKLAESLSDSKEVLLEQKDIFYFVPQGRLKLRIFPDRKGELIYYKRANVNGPKESQYFISAVGNPTALNEILSMALGVRGIVRKKRSLFLTGQTRIHLDKVEGLGDFLELEVVLREGQKIEEGERIAKNLMERLDISNHQLIQGAYIDLLLDSPKSAAGKYL